MPLTVQLLESKLLSQIAPGDSAKFRRILTQADDALLKMGKWRWVRDVKVFSITGGQLVLPPRYESIMGSRIGNVGREITWEEVDYLEGDNSCPIQGCEGSRLQDQGFQDFPDGDINWDWSGSDYSGKVTPAPIANGLQSWSADGSSTASAGIWTRLYSDGTKWVFRLCEAGSDVAVFHSSTHPTSPLDVTVWTPQGLISGTLSLEASVAPQRVYRLIGSGIEEVTVLARHQSRELLHDDDRPVCQSFRALKQMMMSINFEDRNDPSTAEQYLQRAYMTLQTEDQAARGAAKRIKPFKPIVPRRHPHQFR